MCRLFGMTAGEHRVTATFWLLESSDALVRQSTRNPDGTGLGTFDEHGHPVVEKAPLAAFEDSDFAAQARERCSSTFVAHVRYATGTPHTKANTHPFEIDGRLGAHNGQVGDLSVLEERLGEDMAMVHGDTDSERILALVAQEARTKPMTQALTDTVRWLAENVPVYAINLVITTATELWAVRYPQTHELWVLQRPGSGEPARHRSQAGTRVHSDDLAEFASVVVASEKLDDDAQWRLLEPGTVLHVGPDLQLDEEVVLTDPPRTPMHPEVS